MAESEARECIDQLGEGFDEAKARYDNTGKDTVDAVKYLMDITELQTWAIGRLFRACIKEPDSSNSNPTPPVQ